MFQTYSMQCAECDYFYITHDVEEIYSKWCKFCEDEYCYDCFKKHKCLEKTK